MLYLRSSLSGRALLTTYARLTLFQASARWAPTYFEWKMLSHASRVVSTNHQMPVESNSTIRENSLPPHLSIAAKPHSLCQTLQWRDPHLWIAPLNQRRRRAKYKVVLCHKKWWLSGSCFWQPACKSSSESVTGDSRSSSCYTSRRVDKSQGWEAQDSPIGQGQPLSKWWVNTSSPMNLSHTIFQVNPGPWSRRRCMSMRRVRDSAIIPRFFSGLQGNNLCVCRASRGRQRCSYVKKWHFLLWSFQSCGVVSGKRYKDFTEVSRKARKTIWCLSGFCFRRKRRIFDEHVVHRGSCVCSRFLLRLYWMKWALFLGKGY